MKSAEEIMQILETYDLTGSYRDAAELAGCSHHTVAHWVRGRAGGRLTPVCAQRRPMLIDAFLPKLKEWVDRSRGNPEIDATRDLSQFAAYVEVLLHDKDAAMKDLTEYLNASPGLIESFAASPGWWFDDLKDLPAYRRLIPSPR